jgi:DNA modification methylase
MPEYQDTHISLLQGDALSVLKSMPDESVDMCMTSPPYWGLRDYHADGQIGLEKTFQEYIDHLMQIFDEVKRVLKKTGVVFVNIADSYAGGGRGNSDTPKQASNTGSNQLAPMVKCDVPSKSLIGIPERFALAMTDQLGFIRRNTIIWWKRNPMPESVKDRFTEDFEYLYMFSKSPKYYFEQQFEPANDWGTRDRSDFRDGTDDPMLKHHGSRERTRKAGEGQDTEIGTKGCCGDSYIRNKRTTWDIPTQSNGYQHYAAYPEKLCETPILAGCPAAICTKCGKAREKVYEKGELVTSGPNKMVTKTQVGLNEYHEKDPYGDLPKRELFDKGYSDCGCGAEFIPGTVLDPFAGTGTTGAVSKMLGRKSVLIELSPKYCEIIKKRMQRISIPMEVNIA